jgi:hypothetical protein
MEINLSDGKITEERADLRHVVERQDELALHCLQPFGERREVFRLEVVVVELAAIVGWIELEERRRPVIPFENLLIRQGLDLHPRQTLMSCFD